mgnify:FL=1
MKTTKTMKKRAILFMTATLLLVSAGCGKTQGGNGTGQGSGESEYADSLEVLNTVVKVYGEDELFAMYGGDQANAVMDAPGKFDISKTDELDFTLGLPQEQFSSLEDAASMVHMMNANTFTGAVYRLKDGTDMDAFADAVKSNLLARQWVCGQPDTILIINVDGRYVITAFGVAEMIEIFKNHALETLTGAQVMVEAPVI